jgi:glyoxylase-like metal-dependent hydrolase (beta-lactamase superfamily II)
MTEPKEIADHLDQVEDGLFHWHIHNSAIGGNVSSSQALVTHDACVLVDPVRLQDDLLATLPAPTAIALTARCHQRAAWRYRSEFGAKVWLPEDAAAADEEPDERYAEGDTLPGGLLAVRTPWPEWPHYSFLLDADPGVLFCSDLVMRPGGKELRFVPFEYHEDPAATRHSVERLLELSFEVLCLAHGKPLTDDPKSALRELLDKT